jgi:glyoxylase I family protein
MTIDAPAVKLDHVTINVSDIERSTQFYTRALGFQYQLENRYGAEVANINRVQGDFRVHSRHFLGDGLTLILNRIEIPADPLPRPRLQLGLTNFAIRVDDLDAAAARVKEFGGEVFDDTRAILPIGETRSAKLVVCADPDGQWLELIQLVECSA